jgi:hypothetical protein
MATTSVTLVGHAADSAAPIQKPSPATGHDLDIRQGDDPSGCDAAAHYPNRLSSAIRAVASAASSRPRINFLALAHF